MTKNEETQLLNNVTQLLQIATELNNKTNNKSEARDQLTREDIKVLIQYYMKPEYVAADFFPNPGTTDIMDERYYIGDKIPQKLMKLIEDYRVST